MCIVLWGFLRVSSTNFWVSQGFPRGFPGVSVVSSTVASVFEAQSKERAKFLRGVNVHCSKGVSEGFLYKVLGFPGVPWVSCTVVFMTSAGLNNLVPLAAPQAPKSVYRPEDAAVSHCHTSNHC